MSDLVSARDRLEAAMVDTCEIYAPVTGSGTLNEVTGVVAAAAGDLLYEGDCLVTAESTVARTRDRGGERESTTRYKHSIPLDSPTIPVGATIVMTSSNDPAFDDATFVIRQIFGGTYGARRRFAVDLVEIAPR